jgi:hypothetical protein
MVNITLGTGDWRRSDYDEPNVLLRNRMFETNPTNQELQASLLSRPGFRRWLEVGEGPIRAMYSQQGAFSDKLFVVSYESLYSVDQDEIVTLLGNGIEGGAAGGSPSMVATSTIGTTPAYLYIADGSVLWLYLEIGYAKSILQLTGALSNNDTVRIGSTYYKWTNAGVNVGTPAGTVGSPWLVNYSATGATALTNLRNAINKNGIAGTDYSTALVIHPDVTCINSTATQMAVRAKVAGTGGNAILTQVIVGAFLAWNGATLLSGGLPGISQVAMPDDVGPISLAYINGYVVIVIAQGNDVNGRFYWIRPGAVIVEALDFATAERSPDPLHAARVYGDQLWFLGESTTEIWYPTGDADNPFQRSQGRLFDRGVWEGTDVQLKESIVLVDVLDGTVYKISGAGPQRISTHSIEERIRKAMNAGKALGS